MNNYIDKDLVRQRFSKARYTYSDNAVIQKHIAEQMNNIIKRFAPQTRKNNVLEIGCGTGLFTRIFLKENAVEKLIMNDICEEMEFQIYELLNENSSFLPGDAESIDLPENQDMIISCSAIQWFENPIGFLNGCRKKLKDSGILAISTFAPDNFREIASVNSSMLRYIDMETIRDALAEHYDIIYSGEEKICLYFNSPEDVLRHLKKTGVNGIRKEKWTRKELNSFITRYKELFSTENNMVTLTYNPIYIICKKKNHEKE